MAGKITVRFLGDTASLDKASKRAAADVDRFGKQSKSTFKSVAAGVLSANLAGRAVSFLGDSMKEAAAEQAQIATLGKVLKNAGVPKSVIDSTGDWVTKLQNSTGVMDDELRPALAKLVSAGVPLVKAQELLGQALDISTARGVDLQSVTVALGKAYHGSTGALGKMGLAVKDAKGKTLSFDQVMRNAAKTMGGTAKAAANTAAGKFKIMQAKLADVREEIGAKLIPVMSKLGEWLVKIIDWIGKNSAVMGPLVAVISAVTAATWLWNAAMAANPVGLVVIGIAALVAGLVTAYNKVGWFRDAVNKLGSIIKAVFSGIWTGLKWAWEHIGSKVFDDAKTVIGGLADAFTAVKDVVVKIWNGLFDEVKKIWDKITTLWDGVKSAYDAVFGSSSGSDQKVQRQRASSMLGGRTALPHLAKGGIVSRPTVALIGEAGPEAVVPLGRGLGGNQYSITVHALDAKSAASAVVDALKAYERQNGSVPVRTRAA